MKIRVKVKPNSKKSGIEKIGDRLYFVKLTSLPINNKANIELVESLKKYFKKNIKIISGFNSRIKTIEIKEWNKIFKYCLGNSFKLLTPLRLLGLLKENW